MKIERHESKQKYSVQKVLVTCLQKFSGICSIVYRPVAEYLKLKKEIGKQWDMDLNLVLIERNSTSFSIQPHGLFKYLIPQNIHVSHLSHETKKMELTRNNFVHEEYLVCLISQHAWIYLQG